jgi:ubiquinone/menaquinone biosynthesis C-methylase UbiE
VYAAFLPAASRSRARDAIDGRIRDVVWSAVAPLIAPLARTRPGLVAVDLGSGEGNDVAALRDALGPAACLVAIDLRPGALQALRRSGLPAQPVVAHASRLPFADGRVDLVLQSTMLSSVLSAVRRAAITGEIRRVLGPGGLFVSLDMRLPSPRNRNIQPIRRAELRRAFAGWDCGSQSIVLAPPLQRMLRAASPRLATAAEAVPFLRSHLLFWARRPCA